jgi:hypothetical protein
MRKRGFQTREEGGEGRGHETFGGLRGRRRINRRFAKEEEVEPCTK